MNFAHCILGNCFLELEPGNYQAKEAKSELDEQSNLLQFSQTDNIDCNILNLVFVSENRTSSLEVEISFGYYILMVRKLKKDQGLVVS